MVFLLDKDSGVQLGDATRLSARLDEVAQAMTRLTSVSKGTLTRFLKIANPVFQDILRELIALERATVGPTVFLDSLSWEVVGRWQLLAQTIGRLKATLAYNDSTFRILLEQIEGLAVNFKNTTTVQIVREYLEDASFSAQGAADTSILTQYATEPRVRFSDIIGMDRVKEQIRFIMFKVDAKWTVNASYNRMLLYGPPGTGKTLFAEATAHELGYLYIKLTNSDLAEQYVGVAERKLTGILRAASSDTAHKGVFILLDEVDSFTGRGSDVSTAQKSITTTLLQEVNNSLSNHMFLCATTNFPKRVEAALLRRLLPGVPVMLPDEESARQFIVRKSLLGRLMENTNLVEAMVERRFSQDNITQYFLAVLDEIARWGVEANQLYSSAPGYSFTALYNNVDTVTTVFYRDPAAGSFMSAATVAGNLNEFGIPQNLSAFAAVDAYVKQTAKEKLAVIITSSPESVRDALTLDA